VVSLNTQVERPGASEASTCAKYAVVANVGASDLVVTKGSSGQFVGAKG